MVPRGSPFARSRRLGPPRAGSGVCPWQAALEGRSRGRKWRPPISTFFKNTRFGHFFDHQAGTEYLDEAPSHRLTSPYAPEDLLIVMVEATHGYSERKGWEVGRRHGLMLEENCHRLMLEVVRGTILGKDEEVLMG